MNVMCILIPSFKDIALDKKPVSTTYIRKNEEHIDFKDIRLYFECFKKQNLNFVEILFTDYCIVNSKYAHIWKMLRNKREEIAHYCPYRAVKTMTGCAMEKYHALKHEYPSKIEVIKKYGYDPKQLHHLARMYYFIYTYTKGKGYKECLIPTGVTKEQLIEIKKGKFSLEEAERLAEDWLRNIKAIEEIFCNHHPITTNQDIDELFENVLLEVFKIRFKKELGNEL